MTTTGPTVPDRRTHRESGWAQDLEVRQLRAFVLLVDHGSMSAAARALGVSQSTVSEVVAALERTLATRIVSRRRGGRSLALTPAGEALLPYARDALAALTTARLAVAAVDQHVRASVELIANESVSTYLLPHALGEVRRQWPHMRFTVTVGMCPQITSGLSDGRYDVGLMLQTPRCLPAPSSQDVQGVQGVTGMAPEQESLSEVPLVVFAGPDHPLVSRRRVSAVARDHFAPYTLFVSDARGYFFELVRDFFRSDEMPSPRLEATGSVEAVKHSVASDPLGLGVLPLYALGAELRAGRLRTVSVRPELPRMRLMAMRYRAQPPAHPAVIALLDVLRTSLRTVPGFGLHGPRMTDDPHVDNSGNVGDASSARRTG
jgi:molybdate transport repressor ModE-like protein